MNIETGLLLILLAGVVLYVLCRILGAKDKRVPDIEIDLTGLQGVPAWIARGTKTGKYGIYNGHTGEYIEHSEFAKLFAKLAVDRIRREQRPLPPLCPLNKNTIGQVLGKMQELRGSTGQYQKYETGDTVPDKPLPPHGPLDCDEDPEEDDSLGHSHIYEETLQDDPKTRSQEH